jgi:hypothetical protein
MLNIISQKSNFHQIFVVNKQMRTNKSEIVVVKFDFLQFLESSKVALPQNCQIAVAKINKFDIFEELFDSIWNDLKIVRRIRRNQLIYILI